MRVDVVLFFYLSLILARASASSPPMVETEQPRVFFLFLIYNQIFNVDLWNAYFATIPNKNMLSVFIHTNQRAKFIRPAFVNMDYVVVDEVFTKYCKASYAMNALFDAALNVSRHERDVFALISADTIPTKPFRLLYSYFTNQLAPSYFCVAPTHQWIELTNDLFAPKSHNWIVLNRTDAHKAVSTWRAKPYFEDIYSPPYEAAAKRIEKLCWEEYWLVSAVLGFCDRAATLSACGLTMPLSIEQGNCTMYAWWEDYQPGSAFLSHGIPVLGHKHTRGVQTIYIAPEEFMLSLRSSPNFFFARKFRGDVSGHGVELKNGSLVPLFEATRLLAMYD